ncbi:MAG: hypothetical protein ACE5EX_02505 [Phycisphaerae bacterium]
MNTARACVLVAALTALALSVVMLRARQARSAAAMLRAESQRLALRRQWWSLKAQAAGLRAPFRIRERLLTLPPNGSPIAQGSSDNGFLPPSTASLAE